MDISYINKVKEWVKVDNQILETQESSTIHIEALAKTKEKIEPLQEKKKEIEDDILQYVQKQKLENLTLNIGDGDIKFGKKTSSSPLSIKSIKAALEKYNEENRDAIPIDKICDYIIQSSDKKTNYFIKRNFSKKS
jgi:hypothetical protein